MFYKQRLVQEVRFNTVSERLGQAILLMALLMLLLADLPSAQAQGKTCYILGRSTSMWMPSSGYVSGTLPVFLNGYCTPPAEGTYGAGSDGVVYAGSQASAIEKCNRGNGNPNNSVARLNGSSLWDCRPSKGSRGNSSSGDGGNSSNGDGGSSWAPAPKIAPTQLPMGGVQVSAALGTNSGIQFQRFDHYAVGIQSVVDMGVLDLVDVWGNATQYFEVCFPQAGKVIFLDAATSPRTVVDVSNFKRDGNSCASMNRAGTMVLVKSSSESSATNQAIAQSFIDSTTDPVDSAINLNRCEVTPSHKLNLRDEPWGEILTVVPKDTTVTATARTQSWFKVTYSEQDIEGSDNEDNNAEPLEGWIAAWLSETDGDCSWDSDDKDSPTLASTRFLAQDEYLSIA